VAPVHKTFASQRKELAGSFFNRHAITPVLQQKALTACPHTVAGSLSLPSRGSFHRSLTVLSAIGRRGSLALERGRPSFPPDFSCRVVLTLSLPGATLLGDGALTLSGGPSQGPSPKRYKLKCRGSLPRPKVRSTPFGHRRACHSVQTVWALPRSLAATGGISFDFSAEGTEMFQFPCGPPLRVTSKVGFPHSDTDGSQGARPLPVAFGARHRPSSAPRRQGIPRARLSSCASSLARGRVFLCVCRCTW
jgi:hypothetical protein